jgi:hypothetical protein
VLDALGLTWSDLHRGAARPRRPCPDLADPRRAALAAELARERRRRKRLALAFDVYKLADFVRALYGYAVEAHRLAGELGPAHPDVWAFVAVAAYTQKEVAILETALDRVDLRGAA